MAIIKSNTHFQKIITKKTKVIFLYERSTMSSFAFADKFDCFIISPPIKLTISFTELSRVIQ